MNVALFVSMAVALVVPMVLFAPVWKAAEDRSRAHRRAQDRIQARLLRFDI